MKMGSTPATAQSFLAYMAANRERFRLLFMSLSPDQKQEFEAYLEVLGKQLLDARSVSFRAVFAPDILAQQEYLLLIMISQSTITDPERAHRTAMLGSHRWVVMSLTEDTLNGLESRLKHYMTKADAESYDEQMPGGNAPILLNAKEGSYSLFVIRGTRPE